MTQLILWVTTIFLISIFTTDALPQRRDEDAASVPAHLQDQVSQGGDIEGHMLEDLVFNHMVKVLNQHKESAKVKKSNSKVKKQSSFQRPTIDIKNKVSKEERKQPSKSTNVRKTKENKRYYRNTVPSHFVAAGHVYTQSSDVSKSNDELTNKKVKSSSKDGKSGAKFNKNKSRIIINESQRKEKIVESKNDEKEESTYSYRAPVRKLPWSFEKSNNVKSEFNFEDDDSEEGDKHPAFIVLHLSSKNKPISYKTNYKHKKVLSDDLDLFIPVIENPDEGEEPEISNVEISDILFDENEKPVDFTFRKLTDEISGYVTEFSKESTKGLLSQLSEILLLDSDEDSSSSEEDDDDDDEEDSEEKEFETNPSNYFKLDTSRLYKTKKEENTSKKIAQVSNKKQNHVESNNTPTYKYMSIFVNNNDRSSQVSNEGQQNRNSKVKAQVNSEISKSVKNRFSDAQKSTFEDSLRDRKSNKDISRNKIESNSQSNPVAKKKSINIDRKEKVSESVLQRKTSGKVQTKNDSGSKLSKQNPLLGIRKDNLNTLSKLISNINGEDTKNHGSTTQSNVPVTKSNVPQAQTSVPITQNNEPDTKPNAPAKQLKDKAPLLNFSTKPKNAPVKQTNAPIEQTNVTVKQTPVLNSQTTNPVLKTTGPLNLPKVALPNLLFSPGGISVSSLRLGQPVRIAGLILN